MHSMMSRRIGMAMAEDDGFALCRLFITLSALIKRYLMAAAAFAAEAGDITLSYFSPKNIIIYTRSYFAVMFIT